MANWGENLKKSLQELVPDSTVDDWVYVGGNQGTRLDYWRQKYPDRDPPELLDKCSCGHKIQENCYIMYEEKIAIVGSCCIKRYLPKENRGKTCSICGIAHRNRKNDLCNNCRKFAIQFECDYENKSFEYVYINHKDWIDTVFIEHYVEDTETTEYYFPREKPEENFLKWLQEKSPDYTLFDVKNWKLGGLCISGRCWLWIGETAYKNPKVGNDLLRLCSNRNIHSEHIRKFVEWAKSNYDLKDQV